MSSRKRAARTRARDPPRAAARTKWYNVFSANHQGPNTKNLLRRCWWCHHSLQRCDLPPPPFPLPSLSLSPSSPPPLLPPLTATLVLASCSLLPTLWKNVFSRPLAKLKWLKDNVKYIFPKNIDAVMGINWTFSPRHREPCLCPGVICSLGSHTTSTQIAPLPFNTLDLRQRN